MWQSIASSMWTVIESNLGIIVACMPALRRPIAMFFPMLLGKMGRTTAHSTTRQPNEPPTHTSAAALSLERPMKRAYSPATYSSPDDLWLQKHNPANAGMDTNDSDETINVSEDGRESNDHILMGRQDFGRDHGANRITKTTEVQIEPASDHRATDPRWV